MDKSAIRISLLLVAAIFFFQCGGGKPSLLSQPPSPPEGVLVNIPTNCPAENRKFAGKWTGRVVENNGQPAAWANPWNGLNTVIYIRPFKERDEWMADVTHCWGDSPEWSVKKGFREWRKVEFQKQEGKLVLTFQNELALWTISIDSDGALIFSSHRAGKNFANIAKLKREQ